jgi:hypothetical protein
LQTIIIYVKPLNWQGIAALVKMLNQDFNFQDVPNGWVLCFNEKCKMKETCLRYMAAQFAPADMTTATCVTPHAQKGDSCTKFVTERYDTEAWGMSHLFEGIRHEHYAQLRNALFTMLGKRNFYRYNSGEWSFSVKQQKQIADLFKRFGYQHAPTYDHYVKRLQFPF